MKRERQIHIPSREALLSVFLSVSIAVIGWQIYVVWQPEPLDVLAPITVSSAQATNVAVVPTRATLPTPSTEMIVSKNLFDPERGAGASRESEASAQAFQRVKNMVLVGTIILGENRTAILHDPGDLTRGAPNQTKNPISMRMKVGDDFEGFTLSEIADKKVVFAKGTATVELGLDYFKKIEMASSRPSAPGQIVAGGPAAPRSIPNLPRRERLPVGPNR